MLPGVGEAGRSPVGNPAHVSHWYSRTNTDSHPRPASVSGTLVTSVSVSGAHWPHSSADQPLPLPTIDHNPQGLRQPGLEVEVMAKK